MSHYCRFALHSALAMLVVGALCHCSWEEARELAQRTSVAAQHRMLLPSPIQAPAHGCDRESGCICQGATLAQAVNVAELGALNISLLPLDAGPVGTWAAEAATIHSVQLDELVFNVPPCSGQQLRALYASFVI